MAKSCAESKRARGREGGREGGEHHTQCKIQASAVQKLDYKVEHYYCVYVRMNMFVYIYDRERKGRQKKEG